MLAHLMFNQRHLVGNVHQAVIRILEPEGLQLELKYIFRFAIQELR